MSDASNGQSRQNERDPYEEVRRRVTAGEFPGIGRPESNYFKSPNDLINIFARILADTGDEEQDIPPGTASACLVYHYVLRHTWGFHEYGIAKRITTDEFMEGRKLRDGSRMDRGTNLSKVTVLKSLKFLERRGYLEVERDEGDRGRIAKFYRLRMAPGIEDDYP